MFIEAAFPENLRLLRLVGPGDNVYSDHVPVMTIIKSTWN